MFPDHDPGLGHPSELPDTREKGEEIPASVGEGMATVENSISASSPSVLLGLNSEDLSNAQTQNELRGSSGNEQDMVEPIPMGELICEIQVSDVNRLVISYESASKHFPEVVETSPGTGEILHLSDEYKHNWFTELTYNGDSHSYIIPGLSLYLEQNRLNPSDLIQIYVPAKGQRLHVNHYNIRHKKLLGQSLPVVENTQKLTVAPFKIKCRRPIGRRLPVEEYINQEVTPHITDHESSKRERTMPKPGVPYVPIQPSRDELKKYPMHFSRNYMLQHKTPCVLFPGSYNGLKATAALNEWSKDNESYTRKWLQENLWVEVWHPAHHQYGRVGTTRYPGAKDNTWMVDFLGKELEIETRFLRSHIPPVGQKVLVLRGEYKNLTAKVIKKVDIQHIAFIKIVADNSVRYNNRELSVGYGYISATRD